MIAREGLSMKRLAFTLTELIAAIAIVAILAAVVFPFFAIVKDRAAAGICAANEAQIALAISRYAQDNNGFFPIGTAPANALPADEKLLPNIWFEQIRPQLKSTSAYLCPSAEGDKSWALPYPLDYAVNAEIVRIYQPQNPTGDMYGVASAPLKLSAIDVPSRYLLVTEAWRNGNSWSASAQDFNFLKQNWGDPSKTWPRRFVRHDGGINVACVDGHVVWIKMPAFDAPSTADLGELGDNVEPGAAGCVSGFGKPGVGKVFVRRYASGNCWNDTGHDF